MNPLRTLLDGRGLNAICIIAWMAMIFTASSINGPDIPGQFSPYAYMLHFGEYAVLGMLLMPYFSGWRMPIFSVLVFVALFAATDEFHQLFVPGRSCAFDDYVVDVIGAYVGAYICRKSLGI